MKKNYIRPILELVQTDFQPLMAGHSYDHADGKQHDFFDDDNMGEDPWNKKHSNLWEE